MNSFKISLSIAALIVAIATSFETRAATLAFENFAPAGGLTNIPPSNSYVESGFRLTPFTAQSAVFDATAVGDMPGNLTDWFGFAEGNPITLQQISGAPFNLASLIMGPSTATVGSPTTVILAGTLANGGGAVTSTHPGLTTATLATLNWTNLESVLITATNDAGIDNLEVVAIPEPTALVVACSSCSLLAIRRTEFVRRWRR
jgi:hypothetical protein